MDIDVLVHLLSLPSGCSRTGRSPGPARRSPPPGCCRRGRRRTAPSQNSEKQEKTPEKSWHEPHVNLHGAVGQIAGVALAGVGVLLPMWTHMDVKLPELAQTRQTKGQNVVSGLHRPVHALLACARLAVQCARGLSRTTNSWRAPALIRTFPQHRRTAIPGPVASHPRGDSVVAAQPIWKWPQQ